MRFVFVPPADEAVGLLDLPWHDPLEEWQDERLVELPQPGISRHIVRFVSEGGELYALKEINERLARREYRILRELADDEVPAVDVLGVVVDRGPESDAILVTRFLDFSLAYRSVSSNPHRVEPVDRLLDALVELLVRLHLTDCFWGDCRYPSCTRRRNSTPTTSGRGKPAAPPTSPTCHWSGRHHTLIHRHRHQLTLHPDRTLTLTTADGTPIPHHPTRPPTIRRRTHHRPRPGRRDHPHHPAPTTGDPLDLHYAVSVLIRHAA